MKYDFHAQYALDEQSGITRAEAIDFLTGVQAHPPRQWQALADVADDGARLQLLAQAQASAYKERARMGQLKGKAGGLGHWIMSGKAHTYFAAQKETYLAPLGLAPAAPDLARLPGYSFALHCTFTLTGAYLSRDDTDFHILDNPVKKEWVFKLPYIAPSQWKGALRAAMRQDNDWPNDQPDLLRLLGKSRDDEGQSGRLYFYPTFFDRIGLEVINPHDRETGAGRQPIYFESVPADTTGVFTLLYVPFDRIGEDDAETRMQVAADLQLVAAGIQAMMTTYGFGAKTSSGFGMAADTLGEGHLQVSGLEAPDTIVPEDDVSQPLSDLPRYLSAPGQLHTDFRAADGSFRYRSDAERQAMKKSDRQLYDKAQSWWEREGKALAEQAEQEPKPPAREEPHHPAIAERTVANWEELQTRATELARLLRGGEG